MVGWEERGVLIGFDVGVGWGEGWGGDLVEAEVYCFALREAREEAPGYDFTGERAGFGEGLVFLVGVVVPFEGPVVVSMCRDETGEWLSGERVSEGTYRRELTMAGLVHKFTR